MNNYTYEAVNAAGRRVEGVMDMASLSEVLRRLKQMGLFPTRVVEGKQGLRRQSGSGSRLLARSARLSIRIPYLSGRVKLRALTVFTRQLTTLIEAGMPLLRGLRILQ